MVEVSWGVIALFVIMIFAIANGASDIKRIGELVQENEKLRGM